MGVRNDGVAHSHQLAVRGRVDVAEVEQQRAGLEPKVEVHAEVAGQAVDEAGPNEFSRARTSSRRATAPSLAWRRARRPRALW